MLVIVGDSVLTTNWGLFLTGDDLPVAVFRFSFARLF